MRSHVVLLLGLMSSSAAAQTPSASPASTYRPGIDVLDYAIQIGLPDTGNVIQGNTLVTARRTAAIDSLVLDLRLLKVTRVTVNDRVVQFSRTDSTLEVPLPRGDSGTFRVRVVYSGPVTDGLIARKDSAGRWTYFGDNWPNRARYWIPSVDHPSDKATVTWSVRTRRVRGRVVVANGSLVGTEAAASGANAPIISRWRESKPIPTYLMVIAAAPLVPHDLGETACGLAEVRRCVRQTVYVAPEQWGVLPGKFAQAGEILRFFASQVGPFPYEKLAHLQSSTRFGGMENASAIFYADRLFRVARPMPAPSAPARGARSGRGGRGGRAAARAPASAGRGTTAPAADTAGVGEGLIAHETAHQWFGNSVTEREWPHLWLSEGFATYFAALWTQQAHGDSAFRAQMRDIRSRILADTTAVVNRPVIDSIETNLLSLLNRNSYEKGGFVLHMLRAQLGDRDFFAGLKDYYTHFKHGTALTPDLQAALERVSGQRLGGFFDQWLRRPGYPELDVTWEADTIARSLFLNVTQGTRFPPYEFPLRLSLTDRGGTTRRIEVSIPAQIESKMQLPISGGVSKLEVDPEVQLLARIAVHKQ